MVAVLGDLGYRVDVVSKRDKAFQPARDYDLVISERLDWRRADRRRLDHAIRVFLATSMNHITHNENLRRRHQRLSERGRCSLEPRRIYGERMRAVVTAHSVVGVGNGFTMGTWADVFAGPIRAFDTHGVSTPEPVNEPKDFAAARRHFLFLASGSQMQKGLDLLLEIFPRFPDLHLYVCSGFRDEPDFCTCYSKELFDTPNIHPMGWITVNGPEFAHLTRTCAYVIYPSCSDGQAGGVVQAMHAGLIPLVTRESGIDTDHLGVTFLDDSLEEIERVVRDVSQQPADWHRDRSSRNRHVARARYSEAAFADRWRDIVTEVVSRRA